MMQAQMIEGNPEEVSRQIQKLGRSHPTQKLRVFVEPEETEDLDTGIPDPPFTIRDQAHLEELLLEGIQSGPATPMTEQDWEDIRQEVHRRHVSRRNGMPAIDA